MTVFVVLMFNMVGGELDKCLSVWNLQFTRKKVWSFFFCLHFGDRIINCSARSAIVMLLSRCLWPRVKQLLLLYQTNCLFLLIRTTLFPGFFVGVYNCLFVCFLVFFVCWSTLSLQLPVCRSRQQLILISWEPRAYSHER